MLVIVIWNSIGWFYKIRFEYIPINYFVYSFLCLAMPMSAIAASITLKHKSAKVAGVICGFLLLLPALLLGILAADEGVHTAQTGKDFSYEFVKEIKNAVGMYRLYRTDCGAICDFGLDLRKEINTPFRIKFVKSVWSQAEVNDIELITTENTVKIIQSGYLEAEVH